MTPSNPEIHPPLSTRTPVRQIGVFSLFGLVLNTWFKLFKFSIRTVFRVTRALVRYQNGGKIEQSRIGKEKLE
jgi:hypothetical protein